MSDEVVEAYERGETAALGRVGARFAAMIDDATAEAVAAAVARERAAVRPLLVALTRLALAHRRSCLRGCPACRPLAHLPQWLLDEARRAGG